jgi:hypothetical protein
MDHVYTVLVICVPLNVLNVGMHVCILSWYGTYGHLVVSFVLSELQKSSWHLQAESLWPDSASARNTCDLKEFIYTNTGCY